MAIKGILFDKDGTLIAFDNVWGPVYRTLMVEHYGLTPDAATALLVRSGFDPATGTCRSGSVMAGGTIAQLADVWWPELPKDERAARARFMASKQDRGIDMVKPLMELGPVFDALHAQGLVLGVGTNDTEASAIAHMREIDVHHYFDVMIGADSVAEPKPSGLMVKHFAEQTGFAPAEIAMVGDNRHDMEEARAGGAGLAIGVLSGNSAHDDLVHLADHVLSDISALPTLLKRLG